MKWILLSLWHFPSRRRKLHSEEKVSTKVSRLSRSHSSQTTRLARTSRSGPPSPSSPSITPGEAPSSIAGCSGPKAATSPCRSTAAPAHHCRDPRRGPCFGRTARPFLRRIATSTTMTLYVERVLRFYRALPQTRARTGPADRHLAEDPERRGVPVQLVEAALCLAALRRLLRPPEAPTPAPYPVSPLHPAHSRRVQDSSLEEGYLAYLHDRLRRHSHTVS